MKPPEDPLLAALAQACRKYPAQRKVLALPNPAHGVAALERLARQGTAWANIQPRSPLGLAFELLNGLPDGLTPLPPGLESALMAQILSEVPKDSRLAPLAGTPGVAPALLRAIKDLRLAGLSSKDLKADKFISPVRAAELRGLLAYYETHLHKQKWADAADMLRLGIKKAAGSARARDWILIESPDAAWSALEADFLKALPSKRLALPPAPEGVETLSFAGRAKPQAFRAVSQDAEAREILRRILAEKIPFDDVEIACAGGEFDKAVLWDLFSRLEIPCTVAGGLPLTMSRPGKALLGYLQWTQSGFEVGPLARLLRSGVVALSAGGEEISANKTAGALERFSSYRGLASYASVLNAHKAELAGDIERLSAEGEAEDLSRAQARLAKFEPIRQAVGKFIQGARWAEAKTLSWGDAVAGCLVFLDEHAAARGEIPGDLAAIQVLKDALGALSQMTEREIPLGEAVSFIRETILGLSAGGSRPRPGHVHITSLADAGWEGRGRTFLCGLTMPVFPGRARPDPFLLDEERELLGHGLKTSLQEHDLRRRAVYERLAVLGGQEVFSSPTYDSAQGRETGPSSLFLEAARCLAENPALTYGELGKALGEPIGLPPSPGAAAADELTWWLQDGIGPDEAAHAHPFTEGGRQALAARTGDSWSLHDGKVPSAAGKFDPTKNKTPVSAGFMGDLAACPFQFFLKRILGIKSKEEEERDPLEWLNRMERGKLLHEVYARFLRELRDAGEEPSPKKHGKRLHAIAKEEISAHREILPPLSEGIFLQEHDSILRDCDIFLENAAQDWAKAKPLGFEVSFGMPKAHDREDLAMDEPVAVEFGGAKFLIRGRVDRIDRVGKNDFEVVDYKTGRFNEKYREVELSKEIQPMFYLKAVEKLLQKRFPGAKVGAFTFLYSSLLGEWNKVRRTADLIGRVGALMSHLLVLLEKGIFIHTWNKKTCERCPYQAVCGDRPWARASDLLESPAKELDPVRRIIEHE